MRVKSKNIQVRNYADMTVTCDTNGAIVFHGRMDNGECWNKALQPKDAVQVWRRMMGDNECSMHIPSPHLDIRYSERDETWTFSDDNVLCVLDFDECMVVAWAIEKACSIALYNGPVHPVQEPAPRKMKDANVWLLVGSSMRGPCSSDKEFAKSLVSNVKAFSSRDDAIDGLREFLRGEVNRAHSEAHFEYLHDHWRDVDDILDEIIESGSEESGTWMYDGTERSFMVELMPVKVKR
jgi:hypothetical protein